jgi:hypothetical protein
MIASSSRRSTSFLITVVCFTFAGCQHKPVFIAPPLAPVTVSVPPPTHRDDGEPISEPVEPEPSSNIPAETPPQKPRRVKKPVSKPAATPVVVPPTQPQVASTEPAPEASIIGQLTLGGEVNSAARQQTQDLIKTTQQRVDGLSQDIQNKHPDQVKQVRYFLKQAVDAFKTGDIEGAKTLANKARILLDDIQR